MHPRACGHTSGPVGHKEGKSKWDRAAQEGITLGSENGDQCADRQAQQGAATDARAVGDYIPKFNSAARREMLAEFQKDSQEKHRKAYDDSSAFIPKSDHWQGRQRQVSTEVLQQIGRAHV